MNEIDLGDVSVFVRVVELGSFSAAARALRAPKSSVSRRISRLEAALGVRLLHRTTRSIALTETGRSYYARVSVALGAMVDAASAAVDTKNAPRGMVRVSAPTDIGAEILPGIVARFVSRYPEVQVEVELSANPQNLVKGRYDLGLRAGPQPDSADVIRKVQDAAFRLFASPEYLDRAGTPDRPEALEDHACLLFRSPARTGRWTLHGPEGPVEVRVQGPIAANDLSFIRRAALAGAGIALLPEIVGRPIARRGELREILEGYRTMSNPLFIAYPSAQYMPVQVRAFLEFLVEEFPQLNAGRRETHGEAER